MGTACVAINEQGQILLSQRGDLKVWNVPGGRLDAGEMLEHAAAREVREETGIEVEIERPVGLYYTTRWQRLNVVFRAHPVGGTLLGKTHETLDNRWFSPDTLPEPLTEISRVRIADALSTEVVMRVHETPLQEYRRLRRKFAWRWLKNLLSGRPEPRYPRFDVWAVAVESNREILRIRCDSRFAPWQQLQHSLNLNSTSSGLQWSGVQQDLARNMLEFVFTVNLDT
jgi:ADP-ribose pyrophosphatase YjhB (NUDIX family)